MRYRCVLESQANVGEFVQDLMFFGLIDIRIVRDQESAFDLHHMPPKKDVMIDKIQVMFEIGNVDTLADQAILTDRLGTMEETHDTIITPYSLTTESMWACLDGVVLD